MDEPRLITAAQLARVLNVTGNTVSKWRQKGLIPFIKINASVVRYDVTDVVAALKAQSAVAEAPK